MKRKQGVLFLCTHNAARSQMAEALLRRLARDDDEKKRDGRFAQRVREVVRSPRW